MNVIRSEIALVVAGAASRRPPSASHGNTTMSDLLDELRSE